VEWSELISLTTCVTVLDAGAIDAPSTVMFDDDLSVGAGDLASGPKLELLPNRPNPFSGVTSIAFALPLPGRASLSVYDATGRLVRTLASRETLAAGRHEVTWNGDDASGSRVAPGVYAVRLESAHGTASRKIHLLR
jgi:hypothetical protein